MTPVLKLWYAEGYMEVREMLCTALVRKIQKLIFLLMLRMKWYWDISPLGPKSMYMYIFTHKKRFFGFTRNI